MDETKTYILRLPSLRKNIAQVEGFLNAIPEFSNLGESLYYNALIAITEAVNNAIIHGNKCDESKLATLSVEVQDHAMTFTVRDYGSGFDPNKVPDPRSEENLLREGGRGVFLIRSLIEDSHYERMEDGMMLIMKLPLGR